MGRRARNETVEDFKKHIFNRVFPLFEKADKGKLEKALASGSLLAVSRVLGIPEKELETILGEGRQLAFRVFADFLRQKNLIERIREFTKRHSR